MLPQPTVEKMLAMRLEAMVDAWKRLAADEQSQALPFADQLTMLVENLWIARQNLAFEQRLRRARLQNEIGRAHV